MQMIRAGGGPRMPAQMDRLARAVPRTSAPPTLDRWFADQGRPRRFDLARSGAASLTMAELLEATGETVESILGLSLDYGAGAGSDRLTDAVRASVGAPPGSGVIVTTGAVEALLLLSIVRAGRGTALVGSPSYTALFAAPAAARMPVRGVRVWDTARGLCLEELAARVSPTTSMVVVNTPHNPSGMVATLEELDHLADACHKFGALLVVDEVARGTLDPDNPSAVRSRGFARGTTVVVGDVSKALGLGGLRIGWLVASDPDVLASTACAKDGTTVASSTLSQQLAAAALENPECIRARVTADARHNLACLGRLIDAHGGGGRWQQPRDGLVAFPPLVTPHGMDELLSALRRHDVGVVPGSLFGEPNRIRVGLGCARDQFSAALERIGEVLRDG